MVVEAELSNRVAIFRELYMTAKNSGIQAICEYEIPLEFAFQSSRLAHGERRSVVHAILNATGESRSLNKWADQ